jgi:hypothetical protein
MTVQDADMEVGQHKRQGDVLLVRIEAMPRGCAPMPRENGGVVLAHGEVTGHAHQFRGAQVAMFRDDGGNQYVRVADRPDQLVHEEHTAHRFSVGDFELGVQVEHDLEPRVVAD